MKLQLIILCIDALLVRRSHQRSTPQDSEYVAAVLEYHSVGDTNANTDAYIHFINKAANMQADIVVFPEATLNHEHPIPVPVQPGSITDVPPCYDSLEFHPVLVRISCAAISNQIYVLINLSEELNCVKPQSEPCPQSKSYEFNTNVVFDREGRIIDRYRKINLYDEPGNSASLDKRLGVFDTDFGVTFGHFICFDLLFRVPPLELVQKLGLRNLIMATMWYSRTPLLVAIPLQEGFARTHDVNLLAAGANNVTMGSSGSGIYSGTAGTHISSMSVHTENRLLVFPVPKNPGTSSRTPEGPLHLSTELQGSLHLIPYPDMANYNTKRVPEVGTRGQVLEISHKNVFCRFYIRLQRHQSWGVVHYKYRIFARDFDAELAGNKMGVAECGLMACLNDTVQSCGLRFDQGLYIGSDEFVNLSIEAEVQSPSYDNATDNVVFYPLSLTTDLQALPPNSVTFTRCPCLRKLDKQTLNMRLEGPQSMILSFGIWGRIFDRDILT